METGKEEHRIKSVESVMSLLEDKTDYISGFYYYLRSSGKTKSYRTHINYVYYVLAFLNYADKEPDEVTFDDVICYTSGAAFTTEVSGSYLVAVYSALKKFFTYMERTKRITENPMDGVERPAPKKPELVQRTYLTTDEIKKCFDIVSDENSIYMERDKAILMLFFTTGIRNTCLTEINVDNVDFENNCVYVVDKGTKPKTCYLSTDRMKVLEDWIERRKVLLGSKTDPKALFINNRGVRIDAQGARRIVKRITKQIGHEITPHKARASFCTNARKSGIPIDIVSKLMNHSSVKVTMDCYIQGQDEEVKDASIKASDYLSF